ncbi:uncharacterized protein LOC134207067 [Armigeres subalbatus]|uniref:uncharacterized protein LOC134207067 n=1 Tax=Armigeres subalbatus TaxID=124917 RepID=UPI002ED46E39
MQHLKREREINSKALTVEELANANTILIRFAQQDAFKEELRELLRGKPLPKHSFTRRLHPFNDPMGIMRAGGRLNLSQLPYQSKHPVLLPKNHPLSQLIGEHFHRQLLHGGGRLLLSTIREEYWPLNGRNLVKSIVRHCFRCTRHRPVLARQQIGQLPSSRVTQSRPFSITGVDYAGPIYLKPIHKRAAPAKAYLCVFVCFATKAVHLEFVGDLSTPGFLAALRRFISRRGVPNHIHSDNGKNFEGAKGELAELFARFRSERDQVEITSACAPHFGGLWEAAVKSAKKHLFRQLGSTRLTFEGYYTVLTQIEAMMNSRPLLPISDDPNDLAALTPAHFLIGTSSTALPDPDYQHLPTGLLGTYQNWQQLVQKFWVHWKREYLQELMRDTKYAACNNQIHPGRLVIVADDSLPAIHWPLARIVAVHPGRDDLCRVVSLRTAKGIIKRTINKICLLPLADHPEEVQRSETTSCLVPQSAAVFDEFQRCSTRNPTNNPHASDL